MERVVGMAEAKSKLADIVGQVKYGDVHFILERRGRPMAVLLSIAEYERLQAQVGIADGDRSIPWTPELQRRQQALVAQARSLRARFGPPEQRLVDFFADLPPEDDEFWVEVLETD